MRIQSSRKGRSAERAPVRGRHLLGGSGIPLEQAQIGSVMHSLRPAFHDVDCAGKRRQPLKSATAARHVNPRASGASLPRGRCVPPPLDVSERGLACGAVRGRRHALLLGAHCTGMREPISAQRARARGPDGPRGYARAARRRARIRGRAAGPGRELRVDQTRAGSRQLAEPRMHVGGRRHWRPQRWPRCWCHRWAL